jgi:hypothetical protein
MEQEAIAVQAMQPKEVQVAGGREDSLMQQDYGCDHDD